MRGDAWVYRIVPYWRNARVPFPSSRLEITGASQRDALERAFPGMEFVCRPPLCFPLENKFTVVGPVNRRKGPKETTWGLVPKSDSAEVEE